MNQTAEQPRPWTFIPSLPKLAPVTIRKNESATVQVSLDQEFLDVIKEPDVMVSIRYFIGKKIAERFGLWQNPLEINESSGALRSK